MGSIFYVLGVLVALFSLISFVITDGVTPKTIMIVLLLYGLGGSLTGVPSPWKKT